MKMPQDQNEYLATLQQMEQATVAARAESQRVMYAYKAALHFRDQSALKFEMSAKRITQAEAAQQVSATQAAVKRGDLPPPPEYTPNPSVLDRTAYYSQGARRGMSAGGGDAFRRGYIDTAGRHVKSVTQQPRTPMATVPPRG